MHHTAHKEFEWRYIRIFDIRKYSIIFVWLLFCPADGHSNGNNYVLNNPHIENVFSGPFRWDLDGGKRYRIVTVLSEVYLNIFIQQVKYGDENCCAEIVAEHQIDLKKINSNYPIYKIEKLHWLDFDHVWFRANSNTYEIKNLGEGYNINKLSNGGKASR